ncbi:hypothetical protein [Brenneria uluponensis]|uniref:hypothetical protein n=1 Tax=Brenneria uluponensis TaxID=3057057 RepID=UPI0028F0C86B|nr:hypothetical protein [Brenneria ulupoensis]
MRLEGTNTIEDHFEALTNPGFVVTRRKFANGGGVITCSFLNEENNNSANGVNHCATGLINTLGCINDNARCREILEHSQRHQLRIEEQLLNLSSD